MSDDDDWNRYRIWWERWTTSIEHDRENENSSWIRFRGFGKQFITEFSIYLILSVAFSFIVYLITEFTYFELMPNIRTQFPLYVGVGLIFCYRISWDMWLRSNTD